MMNCSEAQSRLHDYLDGEMSKDEHRQLEQHLGGCADCRRESESWVLLRTRTAELETEIRPARDLWPAIADRIDRQPAQASFWWLQLAAAAIALAVLSVPLSVWWVGRQETETASTTSLQQAGETVAAQAELARSEDGVQLAHTDLVIAIERHRDLVEDDTLRILEDNMILLDRAIGELRVALDENPQDLRLRMLLASRYQQERKLLQKVSRV